MKDLVTLERIATEQRTPSLEECLRELQMFGKPKLGVYNDAMGWHCSINMFVVGEGIAFEVKSEFNHKTPLEAAKVCIERTYSALKDLQTK